MATITGYTAERMQAIEDEAIVDAYVSGDNLILVRHDAGEINAGSVRGPEGPEGPVGTDLTVLTAQQILDIGIANQFRAGRVLTAADFTNMGLLTPIGLWNLSNLNDSSGNGRNLSNKGSLTFDVPGITGAASSAVRLNGSTATALYIADSGAGDPFRIKTGSFGAWFRSPKIGSASNQALISKRSTAAGQYCYELYVATTNIPGVWISLNGTATSQCSGINAEVCDDNWHFIVATFDGQRLQLYVDGELEASQSFLGTIFAGSGPLNIGSCAGDSGTASTDNTFGSVDEAFITSDILSAEQIENLYCAKIAHSLAAIPARVSIRLKRRRRGATLVAGDFPTQPLRLHNFTAGALTDEGSQNRTLTNSGAVSVPGADGSAGNSMLFNGTSYLTSVDTSLPSGTATRSFGAWVRTVLDDANQRVLLGWGGTHYLVVLNGNIVVTQSGENLTGPDIAASGEWFFVVVVEDNSATDGLRRKLYVDGKLVAASTTALQSLTLGADGLTIGTNNTHAAISSLQGKLDAVFICNYALTGAQIRSLYAKGSQVLAPLVENPEAHVKAMSSTDLLVLFDSIDSVSQVDLKVAA